MSDRIDESGAGLCMIFCMTSCIRSPVKGVLSAEHQVRDRAQRIQIGPSVDADFRLHLLGRHEFRRADDAARRRRRVGADVRDGLVDDLCQAEVADLYKPVAVLALLHDEDVRGLEIAVKNAELMRGLDAVGDLPEQVAPHA